MPPKFGTSGLRGLVTELTDAFVRDYVLAFVAACPHGGQVFLGQDLRPSSPDIVRTVARAVRDAGLNAVDCGVLPTPALALASMQAGAAAVMVTGSHIPADRNGLKFYVPSGEISKDDEAAILAHLGSTPPQTDPGGTEMDPGALGRYRDRYVAAFGQQALTGLRIGIYEHSSAARDVLGAVLYGLGADPVPLARSNTFVPVDTEAMDPAAISQLSNWASDQKLDAIVSTDGDGDRPMVADANGVIVPGDVLGTITARFLGATQLVTPISSNTMIETMPTFSGLTRTRIGSPFVIAGMEDVLAANPGAKVVGYEANGGFILGFETNALARPLAPLMTRDSILPIVAPLAAAKAAGQDLAGLVAALPPRFTATDRLQGIEPTISAPFLAKMRENASARASFFCTMGPATAIDLTDGLRVTFASGDVVHLRPSGNAPEFRCYAESETPEAARALVETHLSKLYEALG